LVTSFPIPLHAATDLRMQLGLGWDALDSCALGMEHRFPRHRTGKQRMDRAAEDL
jgi:hypothetical protein